MPLKLLPPTELLIQASTSDGLVVCKLLRTTAIAASRKGNFGMTLRAQLAWSPSRALGPTPNEERCLEDMALMSLALEGSSSPEVRLAWISRMASAFQTWPLPNCLTTWMAPWTASVANPVGKGYSRSPLLRD